MTKLIGTGPNQAPSNADLGSAAFVDAKQFLDNKYPKLSAYESLIDTIQDIVDIFVYDTTLDSDGGAWRYRTTGTSWYNEPLNTFDRGVRREFPQVAILVLTAYELYILDGDDPDLPMWMVFKANSSAYATNASWLSLNPNGLKRVAAKNATVMTIGSLGNPTWNFISEQHRNYRSDVGVLTHRLNGKISRRNFNTGQRTLTYDVNFPGPTPAIGYDGYTLDVGVLPNAPVDPVTGLAIPTFVTGWSTGISIFTDDTNHMYSQVWDVPHSNGIQQVALDAKNRRFAAAENVNYSPADRVDVWAIKSGDQSTSTNIFRYYLAQTEPASTWLGANAGGGEGLVFEEHNNVLVTLNYADASGNRHPAIVRYTQDFPQAMQMYNWTTSYYNTGWMPYGTDIAAICDTHTGPISNKNFVTKGEMNSADDVNGWTGYNATGAYVSSGGVSGSGYLQSTSTANGITGTQRQFSGFIRGRAYRYSAWVYLETNGEVRIQISGIGLRQNSGITATTGTWVYIEDVFIATASDHIIEILDYAGATGEIFRVDQVRCYEAIPERRRGSGAEVVGSLQRVPAAPGAELQVLTGFDANNYAYIPKMGWTNYANDFFWMCWFKVTGTSANKKLMTKELDANNRIHLYLPSGGPVAFYMQENGNSSYVYSNHYVEDGEWHHVCGFRSRNGVGIYVDGEPSWSATSLSNNTFRQVNFDAPIYIGYAQLSGSPLSDGSIALVKTGDTVPTVDQIRRIYMEEKEFFQDNAKITLNGFSDSASDISYDPRSKVTLIGNYYGVNSFDKLRRVDLQEFQEPSYIVSGGAGYVIGGQ